MKLSLLKKMLEGDLSPKKLIESINPELSIVNERLKEKGTVVPISVSEDIEFTLSYPLLSNLCRFYSEGSLNALEIGYISDCIQLSENVDYEGNDIIDYIFEMSDPEINGEFTQNRAIEIIDEINQNH